MGSCVPSVASGLWPSDWLLSLLLLLLILFTFPSDALLEPSECLLWGVRKYSFDGC